MAPDDVWIAGCLVTSEYTHNNCLWVRRISSEYGIPLPTLRSPHVKALHAHVYSSWHTPTTWSTWGRGFSPGCPGAQAPVHSNEQYLWYQPLNPNWRPIKGSQKGDLGVAFSLHSGLSTHTTYLIPFLPFFSKSISHSHAGGVVWPKPPFSSIL